MANSIPLVSACPVFGCPNFGKGKIHWCKADCRHSEKIWTDLDVFCTEGCKWPGSDSKWCSIIDLKWKCNKCKTFKQGDAGMMALNMMDIFNTIAGIGNLSDDEKRAQLLTLNSLTAKMRNTYFPEILQPQKLSKQTVISGKRFLQSTANAEKFINVSWMENLLAAQHKREMEAQEVRSAAQQYNEQHQRDIRNGKQNYEQTQQNIQCPSHSEMYQMGGGANNEWIGNGGKYIGRNAQEIPDDIEMKSGPNASANASANANVNVGVQYVNSVVKSRPNKDICDKGNNLLQYPLPCEILPNTDEGHQIGVEFANPNRGVKAMISKHFIERNQNKVQSFENDYMKQLQNGSLGYKSIGELKAEAEKKKKKKKTWKPWQ